MRDRIRDWRLIIEILLAYFEAYLYLLFTPGQWISNYVKSEMHKREKKSYLNRFLSTSIATFDWVKAVTISTNSYMNAVIISVITMIILIFVSIFFPLTFSYTYPVSEISINRTNINSLVSTAWQVSASVIGISFVLVIFLVEYLRKHRYESHIFTLFSQYTKFHFIVIFGLTTLVSMGITLTLLTIYNVSSDLLLIILKYNILLQITNLMLIIFLYGKTFQFIRPEVFLKLLGKSLDKYTKRSVIVELKKRLGINYLHENCENLKIEFTPFRPTDRSLKCISAKNKINQPQAVTDIHLGLIKRAAKLAKIDQGPDMENHLIIWVVFIGSIITKEQKGIAYISSKVNTRARAHLALAVKLGPIIDRIPHAISENLQISKDELIEAIHNGNVSIVQLLLNRYILIIRSFLSAMSDYNVRFTVSMVEGDNRLFSDWYVLSQIERDYYSILEEALRTTNREIIHSIIDVPLNVIYMADEYRDHLVFSRFARFLPDIYWMTAHLTTDKDIKEFIYDRIWRYTREYMNLKVMSKLEDPDISNEDIETYGGYTLEITYIFNRLLKLTIDLNDLDRLIVYGRAFNEMMAWSYKTPSNRVDELEHYLRYTTDEKTYKIYEEELSKKKNIVKVEEDFNQNRRLIWLRIGGWLAYLVNSNILLPESYREWAAVVARAFPDLETLYKTYLVDYSHDKISREWNYWEREELGGKEKGTSDIVGLLKNGSWITNYYCQRGIELSWINISSIPRIIPFASERDIFNEISKTVETFKASEVWKKTFNFPTDQIDSRINSFLEIHERISEFKKEIEEDQIIDAPIDIELISEFESKVTSSWEQASIVKNLIKKFGNYEERPTDPIPEDLEAYGLDRLEPKTAFIKENKIYFLGLGDGHARALAMDEDARLIELFISSLQMIKINEDRIDDAIYRNLNKLRMNGFRPIILYNWKHLRYINESKYFVPIRKINSHEFMDVDGFIGSYDGAALINLREIDRDDILLIDLTCFAKLVQYRPGKDGVYPLSITITPIDKETAEKYLIDHPDCLINKDTGEKIEKEKAIRSLLQKVHLQIWQRSRLENINKESGIRIHIECGMDSTF